MATDITVREEDLQFVQVSDTGPFSLSPEEVEKYFEVLEGKQVAREVIEDFDLNILTRGVQARLEEQPYIRALISKGRNTENIEEAILSVLLSKHYRKGKREYIEAEQHRGYLLAKIKRQVRRARPIEIVLPSLPSKDKNPLRTSAPADFVDLGEAACIARAYEICKIIEAIYPPGCKLTFLCDGLLYGAIFGVSESESIDYRENIRTFVDGMGVSSNVELIDMTTVLRDALSDQALEALADMTDDIASKIYLAYSRGESVGRFKDLVEGIKPNLNLLDIPKDKLYYVLQRDLDEDSLSPEIKALRLDLHNRAETFAAMYASVLISIKKIGVIQLHFPTALRATVHPKPGQIGLYLVNEHSTILPYHGVPVWLYPYRIDDIRIGYEIEVRASGKFTPVYIEGQPAPFYYREDKQYTKDADSYSYSAEDGCPWA